MDANLPAVAASFPWLSLIVLLPTAAALLMPLLPGDGTDPRLPRALAFGVLLVDFALMLVAFTRHFDPAEGGLQLVERVSWVPAIGLEWSLAADGLSAPLVVLSGLVTALTVASSWNIQRKTRLYFALLLVQASAQALVLLLKPLKGAIQGARLAGPIAKGHHRGLLALVRRAQLRGVANAIEVTHHPPAPAQAFAQLVQGLHHRIPAEDGLASRGRFSIQQALQAGFEGRQLSQQLLQ